MGKSKLTSLLIMIFTLSSCSWFSGRRTLLDDDSKESGKVDYKKYQALRKEYEDLQVKYDQLQQTSAPTNENSNLIQDLNNAKPADQEDMSTVNVFDESKKSPSNSVGVDREVELINHAIALLQNGKVDEAAAMFKQLSSAESPQVRVRAKFYMAEMLFAKKDYKFALELYEEIVTQYAYSGIVLSALGRLIVCSENLNLKDKKDKYYSILHDFFEA